MVDPREAAASGVREVGGFIRTQRQAAQLSLRKLAHMADVSDPYLSQIERGLRRPSADILQRLADALELRAETLYVKAGILDEPSDDLGERILADPHLSESQKRALFEVYRSFRAAADSEAADVTEAPDPAADAPDPATDGRDGTANAPGHPDDRPAARANHPRHPDDPAEG